VPALGIWAKLLVEATRSIKAAKESDNFIRFSWGVVLRIYEIFTTPGIDLFLSLASRPHARAPDREAV
jgi:hypothetical protein